MRSCLVGTALARELGEPEDLVADCFYTSLLMHLGCSSQSHETNAAFGDDRGVMAAAGRTNVADPDDFVATFLAEVTRGLSPAERAKIERYTLAHGAQDEFCPASDQEALLQAIPRSRLETYTGAGHCPHWEQPERAAAEIE